MTSWTIRADRRRGDPRAVLQVLRQLADSVQGLGLETLEDTYDQAPESEGFRDFIDVATISHEHEQVLEVVCEELIEECGWMVDIGRGPEA